MIGSIALPTDLKNDVVLRRLLTIFLNQVGLTQSTVETNAKNISTNLKAISYLQVQAEINTALLETLKDQVDINEANILLNGAAISSLNSRVSALESAPSVTPVTP